MDDCCSECGREDVPLINVFGEELSYLWCVECLRAWKDPSKRN